MSRKSHVTAEVCSAVVERMPRGCLLPQAVLLLRVSVSEMKDPEGK